LARRRETSESHWKAKYSPHPTNQKHQCTQRTILRAHWWQEWIFRV